MRRLFFLLFMFLQLMIMLSCSNTVSVTPEEETVRTVDDPRDFITVTGSVVNLRSGPGTEFTVLGQAREGDSLQVTGGLEDWYRVFVPDLSLFAWIYGPLTSGVELP